MVFRLLETVIRLFEIKRWPQNPDLVRVMTAFCALFTGNLCTDVDETHFHYSILAKDGYRQPGTVIFCVLEFKWWPLKLCLSLSCGLRHDFDRFLQGNR